MYLLGHPHVSTLLPQTVALGCCWGKGWLYVHTLKTLTLVLILQMKKLKLRLALTAERNGPEVTESSVAELEQELSYPDSLATGAPVYPQ